MKKKKYIWTTVLPMTFVLVTTLAAAFEMIRNHYWPKNATPFIINLNIALIAVMVSCSLFIVASAARKWVR